MVVVTLDGRPLLADPGFGMSLLRALPLEDGATDDYQGWSYRLLRRDSPLAGPGWELQRRRESGWELMHTTDDLPVQPADLTKGHHVTSTHPTSHFTRSLMITRHLPGRHTAVSAEAVTVRRPGEPTEHRPLRDGELRDLLHEVDVPLTTDEETRLLDVVAGLPPA